MRLYRGGAAFDGFCDGRKQHVVLEGFGKKLDCASLYCPDAHRYVAMAGDEDDGKRELFLAKPLLHFEAIQVRKGYVKNEAARLWRAGVIEESLCRRKG